jgi:hypothetical protein
MPNPYDTIDPPVTATQPTTGVNPYDAIDPPTFGTTPGGAAVLNPRVRAQNLRGSEIVSDIGGAGAISAGMGYAAPAILQGLGAVATGTGTPLGAGIGSGLKFMGTAASAAGPMARTIAGGISGVASETAGKLAETEFAKSLGAGPITAEVARFVGGGVTPDFARVAGTTAANIFSHYAMPGRLDAAAMRTIASDISRKIRNVTGQELSEGEKAYVDNLIGELHGTRKPGEALGAVGSEMQAGAEGVLQSGERRAAGVVRGAQVQSELNTQLETRLAAQRLAETKAKAAALHTNANAALNDADAAARAEIAAAEKKTVPYDQAASYLTTLKDQTTNAAKQTRLAIGNDRPATDIGAELRDVAVKRETKFRTDASDRYNTTAAEVNKGVAKLEAKGLRVTALPAYNELVNYLESQLKPGVRSTEVAAGYKKILDQIKVSSEGVAPSFQAIDDARRLMGESFRGEPAEGYRALDEIARKNIYGKLRDIQVKFAGDKQAQLLTDYADSRPELAVFGSKAGKQMTGLDRGDLAQFATDSSKMPAYFFKTPTSFQRLVDLVGDKALATQAGLDHIANELAAKDTSAKVRTWMTSNREMLNAVPGAKQAVSQYEGALAAAEKTAASLDFGISQLSKRQIGIDSGAKARATAIRTGGGARQNFLADEADKLAAAGETESNALLTKASDEAKALTTKAAAEAGDITSASAAAADKIWSRTSASPQFNARTLLEKGDATQWDLVAPIIQRSPTGKRDVYDALRETLADQLSSGRIKGVTQRFNEVISPAMVKMGMLDSAAAQDFARQLAVIEAQRIPPAEALGVWRRMLLQAVAGYSGSLGSRGGRAGFSLVSDIPTDNQPKNGGQGPKTRAARRNELAPEDAVIVTPSNALRP